MKRDTILIDNQSSGRFSSTADPRLTLQWPVHVCENNFRMDLRVQPVDLSTFTQFSQNFSYECQGLLAVGPIIDLTVEDVTLLKPIQFTLPIFVQTKKKVGPTKPTVIETNVPPPGTTTNQPSQQEIIFQQQQSIFKSMLGEGLSKRNFLTFKTWCFFFHRFK